MLQVDIKYTKRTREQFVVTYYTDGTKSVSKGVYTTK